MECPGARESEHAQVYILVGNAGAFMDTKNDLTGPEKVLVSKTSRRELLQVAGRGLAGALFSVACGNVLEPEARAQTSSTGKIPFSLIVDDGSPVDPLFYEIPGYETPFLVPAEFTGRVAD